MLACLDRFANNGGIDMKRPKRTWELIAQGAQALLVGIILGVLIYTANQVSSAYMRGYEFEKAARREAQLAAVNSKPADSIREEVFQKAQKLGLAVAREEIEVTSFQKEAQIPIAGMTALVENHNQNDLSAVGAVNIDVSYVVPIAFPLHTFQMKFHIHADEHTV